MKASGAGHMDVVKWLVENGAGPRINVTCNVRNFGCMSNLKESIALASRIEDLDVNIEICS